MANVLQPQARLITQNLLMSAGLTEETVPIDWASVHDLVTLIDLYCMYDSAVVLGRPAHSLQSHIGELLETSGFIRVEHPKGEATKEVSAGARRHLLSYLGEDAGDAFDPLIQFALSPDSAIYGLNERPDRSQDVAMGEMWLRTAPSKRDILDQLRRESDVARGTTFVVRSFLYLAYGDANDLVFVPDAVRMPVVGQIVDAEEHVRRKLLATISQGASTQVQTDPGDLWRASPLAAVVFERAQPDRRRVWQEMDVLRTELAPLRKRLREAEHKIFYGVGNEVADARNEWKAVNEELRRSFGDEPHLISLDRILALGKDLGEVADNPAKSKGWIALLAGLPFDVIRRILLRRKAVQLHHLRRELPGAGRLHASMTRLFGRIQ
jgi:hypothetical protein